MDYRATLDAIFADPRYQKNLDWGEPRPGHPEGTVRRHIAEIEPNLESLRPRLSEADYWRLKLLIHTHDSFKADRRVASRLPTPRATLPWPDSSWLNSATTPFCSRSSSTTMNHSLSGVSSRPRENLTRIAWPLW